MEKYIDMVTVSSQQTFQKTVSPLLMKEELFCIDQILATLYSSYRYALCSLYALVLRSQRHTANLILDDQKYFLQIERNICI